MVQETVKTEIIDEPQTVDGSDFIENEDVKVEVKVEEDISGEGAPGIDVCDVQGEVPKRQKTLRRIRPKALVSIRPKTSVQPHSYDLNTVSVIELTSSPSLGVVTKKCVNGDLTQIHPEKFSANTMLDEGGDIDTGIPLRIDRDRYTAAVEAAEYAVEIPDIEYVETPEEKKIRIMKEKFVDTWELKRMTPSQLKENVKFLIDGNHVKPVPLRKNHTQQTIDDKEKYEFQ